MKRLRLACLSLVLGMANRGPRMVLAAIAPDIIKKVIADFEDGFPLNPSYQQKYLLLNDDAIEEIQLVLDKYLPKRQKYTQIQAIRRLADLFVIGRQLEKTRLKAIAGYLETEQDSLREQIADQVGKPKSTILPMEDKDYIKQIQLKAKPYENVGRPKERLTLLTEDFLIMVVNLLAEFEIKPGNLIPLKIVNETLDRGIPRNEEELDAKYPNMPVADIIKKLEKAARNEIEYFQDEAKAIAPPLDFGESEGMEEKKQGEIERAQTQHLLASYFIFQNKLSSTVVRDLIAKFDKATQSAIYGELNRSIKPLRLQYEKLLETDPLEAKHFALEEAGAKLLDIIEKNVARKASITRMLRIIGKLKTFSRS